MDRMILFVQPVAETTLCSGEGSDSASADYSTASAKQSAGTDFCASLM